MTKDEALKLALEALEPFGTPRWAGTGVDKANEAITAIKEALAQPEQEPVAWMYDWTTSEAETLRDTEPTIITNVRPLYTTPPQRKPEQEPCTKVECMGSKGCIGNCWNKKQPQQELVCVCGAVWEGQELIYTTPQRKPLTDKQILADETLRYYFGLNGGAGPVSKQGRKIVNAIEALHNIKETEK